MAHTAEKRWATRRSADGSQLIEGVNQQVGQRAQQVVSSIQAGEELFLQLIEMWTYAGGTAQGLADQLFQDEVAARGDVMASPEEVAKATDLKDATVALHEMYLSMTTGVVTPDPDVAAKGRDGSLRRMI